MTRTCFTECQCMALHRLLATSPRLHNHPTCLWHLLLRIRHLELNKNLSPHTLRSPTMPRPTGLLRMHRNHLVILSIPKLCLRRLNQIRADICLLPAAGPTNLHPLSLIQSLRTVLRMSLLRRTSRRRNQLWTRTTTRILQRVQLPFRRQRGHAGTAKLTRRSAKRPKQMPRNPRPQQGRRDGSVDGSEARKTTIAAVGQSVPNLGRRIHSTMTLNSRSGLTKRIPGVLLQHVERHPHRRVRHLPVDQ